MNADSSRRRVLAWRVFGGPLGPPHRVGTSLASGPRSPRRSRGTVAAQLSTRAAQQTLPARSRPPNACPQGAWHRRDRHLASSVMKKPLSAAPFLRESQSAHARCLQSRDLFRRSHAEFGRRPRNFFAFGTVHVYEAAPVPLPRVFFPESE